MFTVLTMGLFNQAKTQPSFAKGTRIVFLGTGTPNPDPKHQGISVAVVVKGQVYLFDCGPGLVRQAASAVAKGVSELTMDHLDRAFITHLHSDHTMGLPDLMFTPAVTGRTHGLELYGPPGLTRMTEKIRDAWSEDRDIRFHGGEPAIQEAYKITSHDVRPGWIFQDGNLKVKAFQVRHGKWPHAYGYRIETGDRTIVLSGDTTYSPELIENAKGCDVLIHEVYSAAGLAKRTPDWQAYHSTYHTSGPDLARIASVVNPKLLILYHELPFGQPTGEILSEVQHDYRGTVIEAEDLGIY